MKRYIKYNIIKHRNQIIIYKDGKQIICPKEETLFEEGWKEYVAPNQKLIKPTIVEISDEQKLEMARDLKINDLYEYDSSSEVNSCIIKYNGLEVPYWADKSERSILKTALNDCVKNERFEYRLDLRDLGASITIETKILLDMLSQLEVYAIDCYNATTDHLYAIKSLSTIEDIDAYDFRTNYPEKLTFNVQ